MRENIKDLQQRLIDTEAIKEGSNLEAKILQSMGKGKKNKDGELYLTTSYEKYENPNWATDITTREGLKGGTVLEEAQEWLTTTLQIKIKYLRMYMISLEEEKILLLKNRQYMISIWEQMGK